MLKAEARPQGNLLCVLGVSKNFLETEYVTWSDVFCTIILSPVRTQSRYKTGSLPLSSLQSSWVSSRWNLTPDSERPVHMNSREEKCSHRDQFPPAGLRREAVREEVRFELNAEGWEVKCSCFLFVFHLLLPTMRFLNPLGSCGIPHLKCVDNLCTNALKANFYSWTLDRA